MRINVYSQEVIVDCERDGHMKAVELIKQQKADTGVIYSAVRQYLHSSDRLHDDADDDDRSAITWWLPKSLEKREILARTFEQLAEQVRIAPLETGLD